MSSAFLFYELFLSICIFDIISNSVLMYKCSFTVAAFIIVMLSSLFVNAQKIQVDGIFYNLTGTSTVEVTFRGDDEDGWMYYSESELYTGDVIIPSSITYNEKSYSVTSIGDDAFAGSKQMTTLSISSSIQVIGKGAFTLCNNLRSISVENGSGVFSSQDGILYEKNPTRIYFVPKSIQGDILLNESITEIPSSAFQNCTKITTITFPENVVSVGDGAFNGCSKLEEVFFNDKLKTIGVQAFSQCSAISIISLPESVVTIGASAFVNCSNLFYVLFKEGLETIGEMAFYNCGNMMAIQLPSTLKSIGEKAFYECTNLISIKNDSDFKLEKGSTDFGYVAYYATEIIEQKSLDFSVESLYTPCVPAKYKFSITSAIDADSVIWNFGDGKSEVGGLRKSHVYETAGIYSPVLSVWKDNVETKIIKENSAVVYETPSASFTYNANNEQNIIPLAVDFSSTSEDEKLYYDWTIESRQFTTKDVSYLIETPGTIYISLEVSNEYGCKAFSEDVIWVKDFSRLNEFPYLNSKCGYDDIEHPQKSCSYRFDGNDLILFGQIVASCAGEYNTAVIVDEGDTIKIPTYEYYYPNVADCICPFDYEIKIPNFTRDSCVIVFQGFTIQVKRDQTGLQTTDSQNVKIWHSSLENQIFIEYEQNDFAGAWYELFSSQGKMLERKQILSKVTQIDLPKQPGTYFVRVLRNGRLEICKLVI